MSHDLMVWVDVISPFPDLQIFATKCYPEFCLDYMIKLVASMKSGVILSVMDPETLCYWEYKVP